MSATMTARDRLAAALKATQKEFRVTSRAIAKETGIAEPTISEIRHARVDAHWSTVDAIAVALEAMHPGACAFFYGQLSGTAILPPRPNHLDADQLADHLERLARACKRGNGSELRELLRA